MQLDVSAGYSKGSTGDDTLTEEEQEARKQRQVAYISKKNWHK